MSRRSSISSCAKSTRDVDARGDAARVRADAGVQRALRQKRGKKCFPCKKDEKMAAGAAARVSAHARMRKAQEVRRMRLQR